MFRLMLVKLLIAFLASIGVYLPSHRVYLCAVGRVPRDPASCEAVRVSWLSHVTKDKPSASVSQDS